MRKNNAFVAKIVNTPLTKGFMAIFAPAEKPAKSCHPGEQLYVRDILPFS